MSRLPTISPAGATLFAVALSASVTRAEPPHDPAPALPTSASTGSGDGGLVVGAPPLEETPEHLARGLPRSTRGLEVAFRGSYAVPFGSSSEGTGIRDLIVGLVPVQADLGYRFDAHWFVGVFGAAGIGVKGEECRDDGDTAPAAEGEAPAVGTKCDAPNNFRIGLLAVLHLLPTTADVSPWVGLGAGYEWLNISETLGRRTFVQTFSGFELLNVQAGVDFAVGSRLRVGPFAQLSLGRYSTVSADGSADAEPLPAPGHTFHQWLHFGVKASLGPFGE